MATRALDRPTTPQAQAASRLAADGPSCGAPLVLRQHRQTGGLLTGCSASPGCAFAAPHDPCVQTRSLGVAHAVQTLTTQVIQGQVEAQRQVAAERAMLDRTVRQLMALAPPDRWPDTPL